jgi:hypothetical protein
VGEGPCSTGQTAAHVQSSQVKSSQAQQPVQSSQVQLPCGTGQTAAHVTGSDGEQADAEHRAGAAASGAATTPSALVRVVVGVGVVVGEEGEGLWREGVAFDGGIEDVAHFVAATCHIQREGGSGKVRVGSHGV